MESRGKGIVLGVSTTPIVFWRGRGGKREKEKEEREKSHGHGTKKKGWRNRQNLTRS